MANRRFALRRMTVRARVDALNALQLKVEGTTVLLQEKSTITWTIAAVDAAGIVLHGHGMVARAAWDEHIYVE